MTNALLLLASKMLADASDIYSNHGCNDLTDDVIALLALNVDEKTLCAKIRTWNGDETENWPESFAHIGDSTLMHFLADELKLMSNS